MGEKQGVVLTHEPDDEIPKGTAIHLCGHIHPAAAFGVPVDRSERGAVFCPNVAQDVKPDSDSRCPPLEHSQGRTSSSPNAGSRLT